MKKMRKRWKNGVAFLLIAAMIGALLPAYNTGQIDAATTASSEWVNVSQDVSTHEVYDYGTIDVTLDVSGIPNMEVNLPTDVILVLDCSGSMSGAKIDTLKQAVIEFIDDVDFSKHRVGIVAYESQTTVTDFTTDAAYLKSFVKGLSAAGTTATDLAIKDSVTMMEQNKRSRARSTIVLLTDGAANDLQAALEASKPAKNFIFYTIALLTNKDSINDPSSSEYTYIQMLRKMATTGDHYFYSDVSGLVEVYKDIAGVIGTAYPQSVEVSQTVSKQFEIVPKSADNNMPVPVITDRQITWKMPEVHETPAKLSYKVRVADDVTPGTYSLTSLGTIRYKNAHGTWMSLQIPEEKITVKYREPIITELSHDVVNAMGGDRVTIKGACFYPTTEVYLGDAKATEVEMINDCEIQCVMPAHAQGPCQLRVVNLGGGEDSRTVQVQADPLVEEITPAYGPYLGGNTVKITGEYFLEGVKVYFDDVEAKVRNQRHNALTVVAPFTGKEGETVPVRIENPDGTSTTVYDAYTYLPRPVPAIRSVTPASGEVGVKQAVKVMVDNINYGEKFKVTLGGKEITSIQYKGSNYVRFLVPDDLPVGSYDIVVQNGDGMSATAADAYTYTPSAPPQELPKKFTLTPASGPEGVATKVKAQAETALKYQEGFRVTVGGKDVTVNYKGTKYFRFTVPADLAVGQHSVVAYNGTGAAGQAVGTYTVTAEQAPSFPAIVLSPNSGEEGAAVKIKAEAQTALKYEDGFHITIGGKDAVVNYKGTKYFRFTAPTDLAVGQHNVELFNGTNATGQVIGTYTVKAYTPPEPPALSDISMDITSSWEGETPNVKIRAKNLVYGTGFRITFGGVDVPVRGKATRYTRFRVPANLPAGKYDVVVYNGDGTKPTNVGTYTIAKVVPPVPYDFEFNIKSSAAGRQTAVKLSAKDLSYGTGFRITMGGKDVRIIYRGRKYVRFYTPANLSAGSYEIVVYNGDGSTGTAAGTYVLR